MTDIVERLRLAAIDLREAADEIERLRALSDQSLNSKQSIHFLDLSTRASNNLLTAGIDTVGELIKLSAIELLRLPAMGRISINEVEAKLAEHGLHLRDHYRP